MITISRHSLLQSLVELSNLYPDMRFGQLVAFACSIAPENVPGTVEEADDEAVLAAMKRHALKRADQLGVKLDPNRSSLPPVRAELLTAVEGLGVLQPERSLGQLVSFLATVARVNVYDVEDEQLLEAARSLENE
jgi:hypothetical protein